MIGFLTTRIAQGLLFALVLAGPGGSAMAAENVAVECPNPGLAFGVLLAAAPECNALAPDLLFNLAQGIGLDAEGLATASIFRAVYPEIALEPGERALTSFQRAASFCYITPGSGLGIPQATVAPPSEPTVRVAERVPFRQLYRRDCTAEPGPWQSRLLAWPVLVEVVGTTLRELRRIGEELNRLSDEHLRLASIFGRPVDPPRIDNPGLGFVDEQRRLSQAAVDIAGSARLFFEHARTFLAGERVNPRQENRFRVWRRSLIDALAAYRSARAGDERIEALTVLLSLPLPPG